MLGPDILQQITFAQLSVTVGMNRRILVQALNVFPDHGRTASLPRGLVSHHSLVTHLF
jgi:hypothetical protein